MGRWSYDIIGGDDALDAEGHIYDICDIEQFDEESNEPNELPAAVLSEKQLEIIEELKPLNEGHDFDESVLVLGYMMMERGAIMTEITRQAILKAIDKQESFWYDFPARLKVLKKFKATITAYDNQPKELYSQTVFEALATSKEEFVINKTEPKSTIKTIHLKGIMESREVWLNGKLLRPERSQKKHNHSPDGFNWGYAGSGPAQLALAICLELTDRYCNYQDFKNRYIATLPRTDFETTLTVEIKYHP